MKKPRVVLRRTDVQIVSDCQVEDGPRLDKGTEPPHIKEEQEEVSIKQEQEELQESIHTPVSVKSEAEEEEHTVIHLSSPQKHNNDGHHSYKANKKTPVHSDSVKHTENIFDSEDETEITDELSTSSPDLNNISGHVLSDSGAQTQPSSDTEDSDEWSPEPQPGRALKRVVLKARFGKSLKTKRLLDSSTRKQKKKCQ